MEIDIRRIISFIVLIESVYSISSGISITERVNTSTSNSSSIVYDTYEITYNQSFGNFSVEFISCQKVEIERAEFHIFENKTVFISEYASFPHHGLYGPEDYFLSEHGVFICFPQTPANGGQQIIKKKDLPGISPIQAEIIEYITVVCLSLSLICLLLHFIAFLLVADMKNLPGKNIASLTVSMFLSNLIFLIARMKYIETDTCYPLGLTQYYFMMASFFWMNAISFNMFFSFRRAATKLRLISKGAELKRFVFYSLYSWISPGIFLILVIAADKTDVLPEFLRPGFRAEEIKCWFTRKWSTVLFFVAPFGILITINAIFLIFSAFIIFSNSMKANNQANGWTKKFVLYLKLIIIMGLGWTLGLVTSFIHQLPLLYISALVVPLQGFFIFVAFTRFRKTSDSIVQRFRRLRKSIAEYSSFQADELMSSRKKSNSSTRDLKEPFNIKVNEPKYQRGISTHDLNKLINTV